MKLEVRVRIDHEEIVEIMRNQMGLPFELDPADWLIMEAEEDRDCVAVIMARKEPAES